MKTIDFMEYVMAKANIKNAFFTIYNPNSCSVLKTLYSVKHLWYPRGLHGIQGGYIA